MSDDYPRWIEAEMASGKDRSVTLEMLNQLAKEFEAEMREVEAALPEIRGPAPATSHAVGVLHDLCPEREVAMKDPARHLPNKHFGWMMGGGRSDRSIPSSDWYPLLSGQRDTGMSIRRVRRRISWSLSFSGHMRFQRYFVHLSTDPHPLPSCVWAGFTIQALKERRHCMPPTNMPRKLAVLLSTSYFDIMPKHRDTTDHHRLEKVIMAASQVLANLEPMDNRDGYMVSSETVYVMFRQLKRDGIIHGNGDA